METKTKKPIRVAYINANVPQGNPSYRIKLELRRLPNNELIWWNATDDELVECPEMPTVQAALETLCGWYDCEGWDLSIGCHDNQ